MSISFLFVQIGMKSLLVSILKRYKIYEKDTRMLYVLCMYVYDILIL